MFGRFMTILYHSIKKKFELKITFLFTPNLSGSLRAGPNTVETKNLWLEGY